MVKSKKLLTPHDKISNQDKVIRFIFGVIIFSIIVSGGTYYLQSSLFFKLVGNFAHWAMILFLLPSISGLLQHLIDPPARLFVSILGAILTSTILFPLYSNVFWATPPTIFVTIFFTFVIAGIGFTFSINPLDRHFYQRKSHKRIKKNKSKQTVHSRKGAKKKNFNFEGILNSSLIRTFELMLTVIGFVMAIWGTISMGLQ